MVSLSLASRCCVALAGVLAVVALGCGGSGSGGACTTDLDCQTTFLCVADPALEVARCMRPCDDATRLCDDGLVCTPLAGGRACYPGGRIGFGEPCTANLECESGTVCPAAIGRCTQACDHVASVCLVTERCVDDATVGAHCAP